MPSDNRLHYSSGASRRTILKWSAAGSIAALAGCTGGGDTDDSARDEFVSGGLMTVPTDLQFNPENPTNYPSAETDRMLYDPLAQYDPNEGEFIPVVATDWEIGTDAMIVELSEEHVWHDGEAFTADDLVTQLTIDIYMDDAIADYVDNVEATGDHELELALDGEVNEQVINQNLFQKLASKPTSLFGEYRERFEDANGDDEIEEVQADLLEWSLDEPVGTGPFQFSEVNEQEMRLERFDDHPAADDINFTHYTYPYLSDNESHWQEISQGGLDGVPALFTPEEVRETFPDTMHVIPNTGPVGPAFTFHMDHEVFGQLEVRKAIAHVLDRETITENAELGHPVEVPHGVLADDVDLFLADIEDDFDSYEPDESSADTYMEEAGFERDGPLWVDEDGEPIRAPVRVPAGWSDWVLAGETIVNQLTSFGFEAELETVDETTFWGETFPTGDFDLCVSWWGGHLDYPYFGLAQLFTGVTYPVDETYNFPEETDVPMPIGDEDGNEETLAVADMVSQLASSGEETAEEIIQELAWAANQTLPKLPIAQAVGFRYISSDGWNIPDPDDPVMSIGHPSVWLPRIGELRVEE